MIDLETILDDVEKEIDVINEKIENTLECYHFVRRSREEQKFHIKIERECKEDLLNMYKEKCINIKNNMVELFKLSDNIFIPKEYLEKIGSGISEKVDNILSKIDDFIEEGKYL